MKNTPAMADYELRHIEALRKNLAGCTVLLKKDGSFPLEKPCTLAAYGSGVRRTSRHQRERYSAVVPSRDNTHSATRIRRRRSARRWRPVP